MPSHLTTMGKRPVKTTLFEVTINGIVTRMLVVSAAQVNRTWRTAVSHPSEEWPQSKYDARREESSCLRQWVFTSGR